MVKYDEKNVFTANSIVFVDIESSPGIFIELVDFLTGTNIDGTPAALKKQLSLSDGYPGIQLCKQVTYGISDLGWSMRDLIQVLPFMSFVVAMMYSIPLSSIWERKRSAAISAYVTPPRKNTSVVRLSPCWP